ncbi:hypothetical protein PsorP6_009894 [Peronosclerospora sorghi]|uniref:Uncharacterized protein n=1 Tax=Peronosclerospora sorghi TaxID=230839 RepID=A0ACC0VZ24_9STRA|nr:hypothetical protein PsorP6_009894 [Peronosclerospora sorghi]
MMRMMSNTYCLGSRQSIRSSVDIFSFRYVNWSISASDINVFDEEDSENVGPSITGFNLCASHCWFHPSFYHNLLRLRTVTMITMQRLWSNLRKSSDRCLHRTPVKAAMLSPFLMSSSTNMLAKEMGNSCVNFHVLTLHHLLLSKVDLGLDRFAGRCPVISSRFAFQ